MKDDLGDRMKSLEAVQTSVRLDSSLPVYARIDGRSFSRFTKGMDRPFDMRMTECMIETTRYLVEQTHASMGYVQSDEISLVWPACTPEQSPFFGNKVQKLCSVLSGMATSAFCKEIRGWQPYEDKYPAFDCRVLNVPSEMEAANMVLWRTLDASRNAVSMVAQSLFSHNDLQSKSTKDMLQMIKDSGFDYEHLPYSHRFGTFIRWATEERCLTDEEQQHIPQQYRSNEPVIRSFTYNDWPLNFTQVENRVGVVFNQEAQRHKEA